MLLFLPFRWKQLSSALRLGEKRIVNSAVGRVSVGLPLLEKAPMVLLGGYRCKVFFLLRAELERISEPRYCVEQQSFCAPDNWNPRNPQEKTESFSKKSWLLAANCFCVCFNWGRSMIPKKMVPKENATLWVFMKHNIDLLTWWSTPIWLLICSSFRQMVIPKPQFGLAFSHPLWQNDCETSKWIPVFGPQIFGVENQ